MRVSGLLRTRVGARLQGRRAGVGLLGFAVLWAGWGAADLQAQQWRARVSTRIEYIEGETLALDSIPIGQVAEGGVRRQVGDTIVTCRTAAEHCFFYRSDATSATAPLWLDVDLNVFGLGIEGLRFYASTRFRGAVGNGGEKFWPRTEDNFDLLAGYAELNRPLYRVRLGRDYQVSGLGYYGYDGGSVMVRYRPWRAEFEVYGGWGLERGLPERVTSDALETLGAFQPVDDNYLYGFRGSVRPIQGLAAEAIYQREIETDESGITSERLGFEASYRPNYKWNFEGHADYDLATGWWGKAGAKVGYRPIQRAYVEGRLFRYRPVFSLQTIWAVFSPVPYTGYGLAVGLEPGYNLTLRLEGERRQWGDTEAEVPLFETTDRTWRAGAWAGWRPFTEWNFSGGYWLNWGFGSAVSSGDLRADYFPVNNLSLGVKFSAYQQLWEFRVGETKSWSLGADFRWRTRAGTLWGALERWEHNRNDDAALADWEQLRAVLGLSYYLGSEPGRTQ